MKLISTAMLFLVIMSSQPATAGWCPTKESVQKALPKANCAVYCTITTPKRDAQGKEVAETQHWKYVPINKIGDSETGIFFAHALHTRVPGFAITAGGGVFPERVYGVDMPCTYLIKFPNTAKTFDFNLFGSYEPPTAPPRPSTPAPSLPKRN